MEKVPGNRRGTIRFPVSTSPSKRWSRRGEEACSSVSKMLYLGTSVWEHGCSEIDWPRLARVDGCAFVWRIRRGWGERGRDMYGVVPGVRLWDH